MGPLTQTAHTKDISSDVIEQAKVRVKLGFPVMLLMLLTIWLQESLPFEQDSLRYISLMTGCYLTYNLLVLYCVVRGTIINPRTIVILTAILDPIMLSGWLILVGDAGPLFVAFYLFTILGFGFRIGIQPMWICQIASLSGFLLVIAVTPTWRSSLLMSLAFLIFLVIVPLYATMLIKKLRDARELVEFESQAKSRLLANVSHELRTPLTGIIATAQLIEIEAQERNSINRAGAILNLSHDLLSEINDLLDSSKYQSGGLTLESEAVDLHELIERIELTLAPTAHQKGIQISTCISPEIRSLVRGDRHYLGRVLMNFASNAVKFTDSGKVEIRFALVGQTENEYQIEFSISDTGIGIPEDQRLKIFEPFYQVSGGSARKYGGTGLGMSIANDLVTMMGGQVEIESELGKGSTFRFCLNMACCRAEAETSANSQLAKIVYRKNILIADDHPTNLMVLQELLTTDRHIVTTAKTGEDAVTLLSAMQFDLVFLDYNMGDMDGATIMQIYQFGSLKPAPVYFLTADASDATEKLLLESGAAGVLHKPVRIENLRHVLAKLFAEEAVDIDLDIRQQPALRPVAIEYIDRATIDELKEMSSRPGFLAELFSHALEDIQRNSHLLSTAIDTDDISAVRERSHALKSVCGSIGAYRLSSISHRLMTVSLDDVRKNKSRWRSDLQEETAHAVKAIMDFMTPTML